MGQRLLGNFPQAFTHVALVNSAFNLTRAEKPVEQRAYVGKADAPAYSAMLSTSCGWPVL